MTWEVTWPRQQDVYYTALSFRGPTIKERSKVGLKQQKIGCKRKCMNSSLLRKRNSSLSAFVKHIARLLDWQ